MANPCGPCRLPLVLLPLSFVLALSPWLLFRLGQRIVDEPFPASGIAPVARRWQDDGDDDEWAGWGVPQGDEYEERRQRAAMQARVTAAWSFAQKKTNAKRLAEVVRWQGTAPDVASSDDLAPMSALAASLGDDRSSQLAEATKLTSTPRPIDAKTTWVFLRGTVAGMYLRR